MRWVQRISRGLVVLLFGPLYLLLGGLTTALGLLYLSGLWLLYAANTAERRWLIGEVSDIILCIWAEPWRWVCED
jgi:hypothetical protein